MNNHSHMQKVNIYDPPFTDKNSYITCILLVANSTPIVDFDSKLNSFLVNLDNKLLFPTPESPIRTTATRNCNLILESYPPYTQLAFVNHSKQD